MHLVLIGLGIIAVWLVFVFAGSIGDIDRATARQQQVTNEANTIQARMDADKRELAIVQTDAFQRLQARAYGMGATGETVFSLPSDAPLPPPITPLGASSAVASSATTPQTPLDAWLSLLFGN
jgi:cell division protein FtsB